MFKDLEQLVADGYIMKKKHPTHDIYLYDYLPLTTYDKKWNDTTINCRGIVLDSEYNIIARPFIKFFNYEELNGIGLTIPNESYTVLEKLDGSLGIVYNYKGEWLVNTRGSFNSEQAVWAKKYLDENIDTEKMDINNTYLFEIIYPENRIVVDYGNTKDLVLIGIVKNQIDFYEYDYSYLEKVSKDIKCSLVTRKHYNTFEELFSIRDKLTKNEEGFVITYVNGFKFKLKGEEYCKLHKMVNYLTPLSFWEAFDFDNMEIPKIYLSNFPEELNEQVESLVNKVESLFKEPMDLIINEIKQLPYFPNNKEGLLNRYNYVSKHYDKELATAILYKLNKKNTRLEIWFRKHNKPKSNIYFVGLMDKLKSMVNKRNYN
jgi:RNA ligase